MKALFLPDKSWQKSWRYRLENGWTAICEDGHYGQMVTGLLSPLGNNDWHCSSGTAPPLFAQPWIEIIRNNNGWSVEIVRPRFESTV